jgi:hypothetical protein
MTLAGLALVRTQATDGARALDGYGWDRYLLAVVALMPFVSGVGGTPLAWPDLVNLAALLVFGAAVLVHRTRLEAPMLPAVLLAAAGSVLAVVDADSVAASALTLAQDAYLYFWAVALVALLRRRGELLAPRLAAVAVAVLVALACLAESWTHGVHGVASLLAPSGHRSSASFGNANLCADFLLLGTFTLLGLERTLPRALAAAAFVVLVAGMLTSRSNGPLIALAAGLVAWSLVRAHARGVSAVRLAGRVSIAAATLVLAAWLVGASGLGGGWLSSIAEHTSFARVAHSSETRGRIWERLEHRVAEHPLGIGPGNSSAGETEIGERERKGTLQSKEAHSDYLAYAVERGPLGLAGLLAGLVVLGMRVGRARRALDLRTGDPRRGAALHAACVGAFVALLVQSTVIEQLHFRHVWWLVAWMWAATGPAVVASTVRAVPARALPAPAAPSGARA